MSISSKTSAAGGPARTRRSIGFGLCFLTLLIGLMVAVPALGDDSPGKTGALEGPFEGARAEALTEVMEEGEERAEAFEDWLEGPAATAEREASRDAYEEETRAGAVDVLEEQFAPSLEELDADPGRLITTTPVQEIYAPRAARVGNGQFNRPTDVAIDPSGNIWVTDAGNSRVQKFSPSGEYLMKFGASGSGNGQFSGPESLAVDSKGNVWVADTYNGRVQKFSETGEFLKVVGSAGTGQGQMVEATGIDIGLGGTVWVADWGNQKVLEFSETGAFIRQFGSEGTGNGQFRRPDVIEVDSKGRVWVGDESNARIQRFTETGTYMSQFGTAGSGAGQFSFGWPMGIASDGSGSLWIADTGNNRVQKWG